MGSYVKSLIHKKTHAVKFVYSIQIEDVKPWFLHDKPVVLHWQRGSNKTKRGTSKPVRSMIKENEVFPILEFNENITLTVTLYSESKKNRLNGPFLAKDMKIDLVQLDDKGMTFGHLGSLLIDLSKYSGPQDNAIEFPIQCDNEIIKSIGQPQIRLKIRAWLKKSSGPGSQGSSFSSIGDGNVNSPPSQKVITEQEIEELNCMNDHHLIGIEVDPVNSMDNFENNEQPSKMESTINNGLLTIKEESFKNKEKDIVGDDIDDDDDDDALNQDKTEKIPVEYTYEKEDNRTSEDIATENNDSESVQLTNDGSQIQTSENIEHSHEEEEDQLLTSGSNIVISELKLEETTEEEELEEEHLQSSRQEENKQLQQQQTKEEELLLSSSNEEEEEENKQQQTKEELLLLSKEKENENKQQEPKEEELLSSEEENGNENKHQESKEELLLSSEEENENENKQQELKEEENVQLLTVKEEEAMVVNVIKTRDLVTININENDDERPIPYEKPKNGKTNGGWWLNCVALFTCCPAKSSQKK